MTDVEMLEEMFRTPMPETRLLRRVVHQIWVSLIILGASFWITPDSWPPGATGPVDSVDTLAGGDRAYPPFG